MSSPTPLVKSNLRPYRIFARLSPKTNELFARSASKGSPCLRCGRTSLLRTEVLQSPLRLLDALRVDLVRHDFPVDLQGPRSLVQLLVELRRPHSGVELCLRVPLEAALEVLRGAGVLVVCLALVDIPQLIRGVADLVALRVLRQDLLEEQLGPALVVEIVVAPEPLVLVGQGLAVEVIRLGDVVVCLQALRRHVMREVIRLARDAMELDQLLFGQAGAVHIGGGDGEGPEGFPRLLIFPAGAGAALPPG